MATRAELIESNKNLVTLLKRTLDSHGDEMSDNLYSAIEFVIEKAESL